MAARWFIQSSYAPLHHIAHDAEVTATEMVRRMQRGVAVIESPAAIDEHTCIGLRRNDLAEKKVS